jgi:hypothetical protein
MTDTTHEAFFGDAVCKFRLTPELILELERKTGAGIGALCNRLFNREFGLTDVVETIRLGLIGGGQTPERSAELVAAYAQQRPLAETYPLAVEILHVLWFGRAKQGGDNGKV